ncbi:PD-(D/E)XK nuclease superfamily protein [Caloramator mitchellensis]|uniref:CRISPR-associated exonuclease Cas4 n=1 Tax=Caloramator mitchellensis TaxID=908809 RepID=A0A0R3JR03_CALMK|nr:CRISPR-associated protein Cas4 [Caloramator mitchellensis]KRQ85888.1 PD-(D/E)XK nuclease superfamily protein [Caloramator mitchellensis]
MEFDIDEFKVQGIKVNYYYICKRKLWFFSKGITMEDKNDRVLQGKLIHENSYQRSPAKEVMIDDLLKVDIIEDEYVREVKISSKMPLADKMQLIYYLFYLKQIGVVKRGVINYVKEKRREIIELNKEFEEEIVKALKEIKNINLRETPPKLEKLPYCKKCSYFELCYAGEGDFNE